jgi:hypothetical protein
LDGEQWRGKTVSNNFDYMEFCDEALRALKDYAFNLDEGVVTPAGKVPCLAFTVETVETRDGSNVTVVDLEIV